MAVRYLISGGTGNWNSTSNWSATSGGASGASFPIAGDDVIFDIASLNANITINVASACATLTCSDYTGTLTFTSTLSTTGNLVFSTGMLTAGAGTLSFTTNTFSITSNGVSLRNVTGSGSPVITLIDNCSVINLSKTGASGTFTINGLFNISVSGNLTVGTNTFMTGTATMILTGNCTISGGGRLRMNLTINSSGTVTFPSTYTFDGSGYIVTYTAGVVVAPTTTTISANRTFDVDGINWNTIIFDSNSTITLLSKLDATIITIDASPTFDGVAGWETDTFILGTVANTGRVVTLEDGVEYKVNTDFNSIRSTNSNSNRAVLQSSDATNLAIFTCGAGCVMNVGYTNAIRIDSSLGKQVYSFNGVYTTAINWSNAFPVSVAHAYQN